MKKEAGGKRGAFFADRTSGSFATDPDSAFRTWRVSDYLPFSSLHTLPSWGWLPSLLTNRRSTGAAMRDTLWAWRVRCYHGNSRESEQVWTGSRSKGGRQPRKASSALHQLLWPPSRRPAAGLANRAWPGSKADCCFVNCHWLLTDPQHWLLLCELSLAAYGSPHSKKTPREQVKLWSLKQDARAWVLTHGCEFEPASVI